MAYDGFYKMFYKLVHDIYDEWIDNIYFCALSDVLEYKINLLEIGISPRKTEQEPNALTNGEEAGKNSLYHGIGENWPDEISILYSGRCHYLAICD